MPDPALFAPDRFRQALRAVQAGVWEWNIVTNEVAWSDENYNVLGMVPGEVQPSFEEWCRHVHPEDLPGALSEINLTVKQLRDLNMEYRVVWPSGEVRWIKDIGRLVLDASGKPGKMYGIQLDITRQKKAEQVIRDGERIYRRIVETANEGIWLLSPEDRTVFSNDRMAALLGYSNEELMELHLTDLLDARSCAAVSRHQDQPPTGIGEHDLQLQRKDGTHLWAIVKTNELIGPEGEHLGILLMVTDITQRRKARDELRKSREELRRLSTALARAREAERERVARELHDELGQSLTALKIDLQLLTARVPAADIVGQERAGAAMSLVNRTIRCVRRLATDLRPGILDDLGLSAAVEWELQEFAMRTGVEVQLRDGHCLDDLDGEVVIVAFRVLQETLTNVIRHAKATRVMVEVSRQDDSIDLVVTDDGCGFELGQVQDKETFGLLGMRERARSVGGTVEVTGRPGRGTTVSLVLPARGDPASAPG